MAKRAAADDDQPPKARRATRKRPVAVRARRARARRAVARIRSNPEGGGGWSGPWGITHDLTMLGAGLGAYGGTRLVQRLATRVAAKKKPAWVRHVSALSGAAVFGAALLAVRKVKTIAAYEGAIVLGTGLAAVQGVVAAYVPRFAWLMSAEALPAGASAPRLQEATIAATSGDPLDYLDEMERQATLPRRNAKPVQQALETAAAVAGDTGVEEALLAELGDDAIDDLYGGVFADPTLLAS